MPCYKEDRELEVEGVVQVVVVDDHRGAEDDPGRDDESHVHVRLRLRVCRCRRRRYRHRQALIGVVELNALARLLGHFNLTTMFGGHLGANYWTKKTNVKAATNRKMNIINATRVRKSPSTYSSARS